MKAQKSGGQQGFTIIELMMGMVIVGILFAVLVPSYKAQVIKSQRADAKVSLTKWAQALERYYTENNQYYTGSTTGFIYPVTSDDGYYTLSYGAQTVSTYTLQAAPQSVTADPECQTLTLNHLGVKGVMADPVSGTPAPTLSTADCW